MKKYIMVLFILFITLSGCTKKVDFTSATEVTMAFYEDLYTAQDSNFCDDYMYEGNEILCQTVKNNFYESSDTYSVQSVSIDDSYIGEKDSHILVIVTICNEIDTGCIESEVGTILSLVDGEYFIEAFNINLDNLER